MTQELKEKLAKLYEMVQRGATDNEKDVARKLLDKLLAKHNLEDIDPSMLDKERHYFTYTSSTEVQLFLRLVAFLLELDYQTVCSSIRSRRRLIALVSYSDYITLEASYEYFRRHMKAQWERFCAPELAKCRKAKTRNAKRKQLQAAFEAEYFLKSGLYKASEIRTVKLSGAALVNRNKVAGVEGGQYRTQVNSGHLLNAGYGKEYQ